MVLDSAGGAAMLRCHVARLQGVRAQLARLWWRPAHVLPPALHVAPVSGGWRRQAGGRPLAVATLAAQAAAQPTAPPPEAGQAAPQSPRTAAAHRHQTVDYTTLAAVAHELQQQLCPAKVEQALQVDDETLVLKLRTLSTTAWLALSWHSDTAHVATLAEPLERSGAAAEAYTFGAQLQAALRGLVLSGVELPAAWERVLRLDFAERPADPPRQHLHCEIMGRYSNVVLTDAAGTVAAAGYQVGGKMSSLRQVQAGRQYALPPPAPGIDPDAVHSLGDWQAVVAQAAVQQAAAGHGGGTVAEGCVRAFRGVSPSLVRELCTAAGVGGDEPASALTAQQWAALHAQWQGWLERLASHSFAASSCHTEGTYSVLGGCPNAEDSVLGMLGRYYARLQAHEQFKQLKHRLQRVVGQAVGRLEKKIQSLQKQGGQSDKHLQTQKLADLLMANVHRCTPGMACIEVEDWDSPGTTVTIPLDPLESAVEAAEALYRQARKQRRAVDQVAPLIQEARAQLDYLAEVELMLAQSEEEGRRGDMAALREVQAELVAGGYMKALPEAALVAKATSKAKRAQKRSGGGGEPGPPGFREYLSPGGLRVLVGRNSRQNDELTMRVANAGDVWMHARGVPGAHLLLRVPAGQSAGDADLAFAADLAAWFSKARSEGKADVTVASPKDISKPRGAKPGMVMVSRESVLVGRPHRSAAAQAGGDDD